MDKEKSQKSFSISEEQTFAEVVEMIRYARQQSLAAVNTALIDLYWKLGEISFI